MALGEIAFDVSAEDVDFEVDGVAGGTVADVGVLIGVGDHGNFGDRKLAGGRPAGDGEADAVNGERAFPDDVGREACGDLDAEEPGVAVLTKVRHAADGVHVAEDEVAAEFLSGGQRLLEIYASTGSEGSEGSLGESFGG